MIEKKLYVGRWTVYFLFAIDGYDKELIGRRLYDADAGYDIIDRSDEIINSGSYNCGFTYTNPELYKAVVVIGPTVSGKEFVNTFVHEMYHLSVAIAENLGLDLESEAPAYMIGDLALELAEVVCHLGCSLCN